MADKRMFSQKVIDSDRFIEMPISARLLYYDLGMRADDDGFVSSPKKILRMIGASDDDLRLLITKKYLIPFDSGVCVIRDWKVNNYIQADRYKPTIYLSERSLLRTSDNKEYVLDTECIQTGYNSYTDCIPRLDKIRLEENRERITAPARTHEKPQYFFKASNWIGTDPKLVAEAKRKFNLFWRWYEPNRRGNQMDVKAIWERNCQDFGIDTYLERFEYAFSYYCQSRDVKEGVIMGASKFVSDWENWYDQGKNDGYRTVSGNFWSVMEGDKQDETRVTSV